MQKKGAKPRSWFYKNNSLKVTQTHEMNKARNYLGSNNKNPKKKERKTFRLSENQDLLSLISNISTLKTQKHVMSNRIN